PTQKTQTSLFTKHKLKFPLNTEEDISKFEDVLKSEEEFNAACDELARFGGSNIYNFIKRRLTALLSNEQAKNYSLKGRKGKKPFEKLLLARLLVCAAEKSLNTTQKAVEDAICSWLKRAPERLQGYRKKFP
ncbi:unnamed protein product, partial [Callosobruchus maculatus]